MNLSLQGTGSWGVAKHRVWNTWGPMENTGTGGNTSSGEKYGVWRKT